MHLFRLLSIALVTVFVFSCGRNITHDNTIYFDDIRVPSFDGETIRLDNGEVLNLDCIGVIEIAIADGVIFVKTTEQNGALKIFNLETRKLLGELLSVGEGPGEFRRIPLLIESDICSTDSCTILSIPDFPRGVLHEISLRPEGDSVMSSDNEIDLPLLRDNVLYVRNFGDSRYLVNKLNPDNWSITYSIIERDNSIHNEDFINLNSASVDNPNWIGTILSLPVVSHSRMAMAIITPAINQINVMSADKSFTPFTISTDGHLDSYREMIENNWAPEQKGVYSACQGFDDFFVVCSEGDDGKSTLLTIYDWDGNITGKYIVPDTFMSFDIDVENGDLYTFKLDDELIMKYSIPDFISKHKDL